MPPLAKCSTCQPYWPPVLKQVRCLFSSPWSVNDVLLIGPNGPLPKEITEMHPNAPYIKRNGEVNAWDNEDFRKAVQATGKTQVIIAGITTDVSIVNTIHLHETLPKSFITSRSVPPFSRFHSSKKDIPFMPMRTHPELWVNAFLATQMTEWELLGWTSFHPSPLCWTSWGIGGTPLVLRSCCHTLTSELALLCVTANMCCWPLSLKVSRHLWIPCPWPCCYRQPWYHSSWRNLSKIHPE